MKERRLSGLFLLWTIPMVFHIGDGSVFSGQCLSTCLSTHFTSSTLHTNSSILEECTRNLNCSSCIYPCKKYKNIVSCKENCQEAFSAPDICELSCNYMKRIIGSKKGACPARDSLSGFDMACVEECREDRGCSGDKKCCSNGCGYTCQSPYISREDYPDDVAGVSVTENPDQSSATVRWGPVLGAESEEVVLYAVQLKNLTQRRSAEWIDLGVSYEAQMSIPLLIGREYKFRIASINQNGSSPFCRPSATFQLSRVPRKPDAPHSITAGGWKVIDDRIHQHLYWEPPKRSDLPVQKYRVFYSARPPTAPSLLKIEEHQQDVRGSETTVLLPNLLPNMKYFVQVMAIARYGDSRLSSDRAWKYILTPELPTMRDSTVVKTEFTVPTPHTAHTDHPQPGPPRDLRTTGPPFWDAETLKVQLRWEKPRGFETMVERFTLHWEATVCSSGYGENGEATIYGSVGNDINAPYRQAGATTHGVTFTLFGLSFDCTYQVWVRPVIGTDWGPQSATMQILTPPCSEVDYRGLKPVCPTLVPEIPSAPVNMSYRYSISDTISARFQWAPPARSQHQLTGFRIYWAQVKPSRLSHAGIPTIQREAFTSTLLQEAQRTYTIRNLTAGSRYVVKLQALSSIGGGAMTAVDIKTPNVTISKPYPGMHPSRTPPTWNPNEPSPTKQNAAERLDASSFTVLVLITILYTYHIIQR